MTDESRDGAMSTGNIFYDEAAEWFAKMRGPDADLHRAAFDSWLERGALHRAAYNRVAEIFTDSCRLLDVEAGDGQAGSPRLPARTVRLAAAAFFATVIALALAITFHLHNGRHAQTEMATARKQTLPSYASGVGEIRRVSLPDGSTLVLDTDSLVSLVFTRKERRLRLVRGRARFEVRHEGRPFRVAAGDGVVTAHGTIFDVQLASTGKASVILLRGAIDVSTGSGKVAQRQWLRPGQSTSYQAGFAQARPVSIVPSSSWTQARGDFHDISLDELVKQANRYTQVPIVIDDPAIGALRVSGVMSFRDSDKLSARIAALFRLKRTIEPDRIRLSR